jgi:hypothetical protein
MLLKIFNFLIITKIVLSEKIDKIFPFKFGFGLNNNIFEKISIFNKNKIYEKLLISYNLDSKVYNYIRNDYSIHNLNKELHKNISFKHGYHKPIISIYISFEKKRKKKNISYIIPLLKDFHPNTLINDIILFYVFYIKEKNEIKDILYNKIYIKTLIKKIRFKYLQLKNISIEEFYKKLN